ncbi:MAG TPA: DUF971 domain-containing protein [Gammaproteobacteria bacterium]|nr:DUF971 domain-containing protein [Gammaproteobacteria bacterium]
MQHEVAPVPISLTLKKRSQCLDVEFADGICASLSAEFLRVHSPSAEVTGHSPGEGQLVSGKEFVAIERIEPIGRYAVRIVFDDGHDSGLYSWRVLHDLSSNQDAKWQRYLERLAEAGISRAGIQ